MQNRHCAGAKLAENRRALFVWAMILEYPQSELGQVRVPFRIVGFGQNPMPS
jgi:hypothetical protein